VSFCRRVCQFRRCDYGLGGVSSIMMHPSVYFCVEHWMGDRCVAVCRDLDRHCAFPTELDLDRHCAFPTEVP